MFSRREFLSLLALPAFSHTALPAVRFLRRDYHADAVILLFSIPIFTRQRVGGAFLTLRTEESGPSSTSSIEFGAGSDPARTGGLNRLGYLRETLRSEPDGNIDCTYTGFMTASPEATFDQARAALGTREAENPYAAIEGWIGPKGSLSRSVRFNTPAQWNWNGFDGLRRHAEQLLRVQGGRSAAESGGGASSAFLNAVLESIVNPDVRKTVDFVYGNSHFRLETEKRPDEKMARRLQQRGLAAGGSLIRSIHGKVQQLGGAEVSCRFRLWYDASSGNPLPLRFEFQPKPFLALAFEAA